MTRRWIVPTTTTTVVATGTRDGIYVKGATDARTIDGVRIEMGASQGRAGIMHDNAWHTHDVLEDCHILDARMWGTRRYGLSDSRTERVLVENGQKEHGFYDEVWGGYNEYIDCTAIKSPAQGFQWRLTNNRADSHWILPKTLNLVRCTVIECGRPAGMGRASFNVSVFELGPQSDVFIDDILINSTKQNRIVKRSDGTWADSVGGLFVGYCRRLFMVGGEITCKNSWKEAVQLFDFSNKAPTRTGPDDILIQRLHVGLGGNIAVREGDGMCVTIAGCTGTGKIKVYRYGADGAWRLHRSVPITQGITL